MMLLPLQEHQRKDTIMLQLIADFVANAGFFDAVSNFIQIISWED